MHIFYLLYEKKITKMAVARMCVSDAVDTFKL